MKRLLKGILFLFVLITAGFLSRYPSYSHIVFPVCMGLSVLVFVYALIHIKFILKKNIFMLILCAFLITPIVTPTIVLADAAAATDSAQEKRWREYIKTNQEEVCAATGDKESSNYADQSKRRMYNPGTLLLAEKIITYSTNLGETKSEAYKCAKKYANKAAEAQKSFKKQCSPITSMIKSYLNRKSCWPCDITGMMIAAVQRVAISSYRVVRSAALSLLIVMYLFWLVYVTLAFFGKFGFARISEYLTNVLNKSVLVLFVAALLHAPLINIYQMTISPFVQYTAGLAMVISETGMRESEAGSNFITTFANFVGGETKCEVCGNTTSTVVGSYQFLDAGTVNSLLCTVCSVYKQVAPMIGLGQAISCYATASPKSYHQNNAVSEGSSFAVPSMTALCVGMGLVILFSLMMVVVGFQIMSATLKLGFVLLLMPMWMVFFIFKPTRTYTTKAWTLIVHSMVTLIAVALAVSFIMIGFNSLLPPKKVIGFVLLAVRSSSDPSKMLSSFAATWQDGDDPLKSEEDSKEGDSWASGITDKIIDTVISMVTDFSPFQTMIMFAGFALLSIKLLDSAGQYVERLANAYIQLSNVGADSFVKGASTGLTAVAGLGKSATYLGSAAAGYATGKSSKSKPATTTPAPTTTPSPSTTPAPTASST